MITENEVPEIRRMAAIMLEALTKRLRRRRDWPLVARKLKTIMQQCDQTPPPLRSIEQNMASAYEQYQRMRKNGIYDWYMSHSR
jgi:hypothetical protein